MIDTSRIQEHLEVVGSDGEHVGTVDHLDGNTIKLARKDADSGGEHHWIDVKWVAAVDDKVRLSIPTEEAREQWLQTGPTHDA